MALGSGTTAPALTDTASGIAVRYKRDSGLVLQLRHLALLFIRPLLKAGDATGAVTEAGIFNAATSGTMLCRTTFDVINKGASDTMSVTWTITVS